MLAHHRAGGCVFLPPPLLLGRLSHSVLSCHWLGDPAPGGASISGDMGGGRRSDQGALGVQEAGKGLIHLLHARRHFVTSLLTPLSHLFSKLNNPSGCKLPSKGRSSGPWVTSAALSCTLSPDSPKPLQHHCCDVINIIITRYGFLGTLHNFERPVVWYAVKGR